MKLKQHDVEMLQGPLYKNLILYTLPLMASSILQLLYNAADVVVVGRFAGSQALAAVGSCGSLINLIVNLFLGLSVGTSVMVAQRLGAGKHEEVGRAVQTAVAVSIIGGVALGLFGCLFARTALTLMDSPHDVIDLSTLYLRIYFLGLPGMMLYNFGAAVLRAAGDTKRPLYYLAISGLVNVSLNLVFVIAFNMSVAGVALATIISQYMSAALVLGCLLRTHECYRFEPHNIRISGADLGEMARVGLPAGLQGTLFSLSNVIIQSTVNSFGSIIVAGNSASSNLEGFIYVAMNAFHHAALAFTGQNYGARQYKRTRRILLDCQILVTVTGLAIGGIFFLLREPLLNIYAPGQPEVIAAGVRRLVLFCLTYFICGNMDVMVGGLRGLGYSVTPMIVSLLGACAFRIFWVAVIFPLNPTLDNLYTSYPISWLLTTLTHVICYFILTRKLPADGELPPVKKKA